MNLKEEEIIVTGGSGRLGKAFKKLYPLCQYPDVTELDITSKDSVDQYLKTHRFEAIVHLAAMTGIPPCEADQPKAWLTNVDGTTNLLLGMTDYNPGAKFIYLNTACIFPGNEDTSYEDTLPYPEHFYGLTKLAAELKVRAFQDMGLDNIHIVRTNFTSMPWEYPKAFTDRFGTYLFGQGVAKGVMEVVNTKDAPNIIHICGDKPISMHAYATLGGSKVEEMTLNDYNGTPLTKNMSLGTKNWHTYKIEDSDYNDN